MDLDALIAKARAELEEAEPVDQDIVLGGERVTARLWPVSGTEWRGLTKRHPATADIVYDMRLGYDLDAVVADYPRVDLIRGDDVTELRASKDTPSKWSEIVSVLSGPDLRNLALAAWGLNDYDPQQRLKTAGKASTGGRRKKRSSPASSASQSEN